MMELKVSEWKEFRLNKLFSIRRGDRIVKNEDYFDEPVDDTYVYPVVTASATNNGIDGLYNQSNCEGHCIVSCGEANGMFTTWQAKPFWGMDTIRIYQPIGFTMTEQLGLFFATLLSHNMYRFSYGRKAKPDNMYSLFLRLPVQHNAAGQPVIDPSRKYSDDGYVPDWDFMEQYIKSLNHPVLTTKRGKYKFSTLDVEQWKEFPLNHICKISMGNKFDNDKMSHENPTVNFVSRTAENNGVADFVDIVNGVEPYNTGSLTVALGGSIGSCFLQDKPFYTGQNVAVLEFDSAVSDTAKLFLSTLFMHECHSKFVAFGRELNTHIRTDLTLFLPIQHDATGQPVIDPNREYSDDGYIPNWAFMEEYIRSLPGSDLIE